VFHAGTDEVEVFKWDAALTSQGVDLPAALHTSAEDMPGAEPKHRVEYFVGLWPGTEMRTLLVLRQAAESSSLRWYRFRI
jgi:hypothetical protein